MRSNFEDVGDFHEKFGLPNTMDGLGDTELSVSDELMAFRLKFMHEELEEFTKALETMDHPEMFDALLDLVYVAMGTAHLLGYPWQTGWNAVQTANMKKVRALPDGSNSKRGSGFDVVKPAGWKAPDIGLVLDQAFHRCPTCHRSLEFIYPVALIVEQDVLFFCSQNCATYA